MIFLRERERERKRERGGKEKEHYAQITSLTSLRVESSKFKYGFCN